MSELRQDPTTKEWVAIRLCVRLSRRLQTTERNAMCLGCGPWSPLLAALLAAQAVRSAPDPGRNDGGR
jgi:hypothetical protein